MAIDDGSGMTYIELLELSSEIPPLNDDEYQKFREQVAELATHIGLQEGEG